MFGVFLVFLFSFLTVLAGYRVKANKEIIQKEKDELERLRVLKDDIMSEIEECKYSSKKTRDLYNKNLEELKEIELKLQKAETAYDSSLIQVKKKYDMAILDMQNNYLSLLLDSKNQTLEADEEYNRIKTEVDNIKATKTALIKANLREKELKEKQGFYSLTLSEDEIKDIDILNSIKKRISSPRILSMLIWQTYIRDKVNILCNNVFGEGQVTGIYKITNSVTSEVYIGQAVNISTRIKTHCKAGLGIDTPNNNKLYAAMEEYGLHNFTFELLEKCSNKELNQKEAHYIEIYNSYNFGYNSNRGIKK